MADNAEPFYWEARNAWYINIRMPDGKRVKRKLGDTKKAAFDAWKRMLKNGVAPKENPSFLLVATKWLEFQSARHARGEVSASWLGRVNRTIEAFTNKHSLRCLDITPEFTEGWTAEMSSNYARTELATIKQVLKWAVKTKRLAVNPLVDLPLPPNQNRTKVLSYADHCKLCRATSKKFKPLLRFAWLTGARPGELRELKWEHVAADFTRAILPEHKTARKTGKPRVIYFPARAQKLLCGYKKVSESDYVFLNHRRKPWTKNAVVCRMKALRKETGLELVAYHYRHAWITRALVSGVDVATVAELSGHSDIQMIAKVYGHLGQFKDYLADAVGKVKPD
jgi:integrase